MGSRNKVEITKNQREVLVLLVEHGLSQKDIAIRRQISKQAVSKVVKILKQKGYVKEYKRKRLTSEGVVKPQVKAYWRYHALEFEITPYYFTKKYNRIRKEIGNTAIPYGNWKISLYSKKIIMWLKANCDFVGEDEYECLRKMNTDFDKTLYQISQRYGFRYEKDKKISIKILKQHLAKTHSKLSKSVKVEYIQIKWHDGRVYFTMDKSKGFREHEYVHKDHLFMHKDRVEKQVNDWAENNPATNSQLGSRVNDNAVAIGETLGYIKKSAQGTIELTYAIDKLIEGMKILTYKVKDLEER